MTAISIQKKLQWAIILTFIVLCVEAVGGILSNSLALLSDAAHMLTDVFALSLSWLALKISSQPSTRTRTYGYHRIEIFAALTNSMLLLGMALGILWEAWGRFQNPQAVHSLMVMGIATIGLTANLGVIYFLKDAALHTHRHDLNIKSAFYHVLGDCLASVAVIIGAGVMWATQWYVLDSIIAALVAAVLVWGAGKIIRDSLHILLEGVPKGISLAEVEKELVALPEVNDIHELHIWCICSNIYALSTHALVNDQRMNQAENILADMKNLLEEKFNITHSTIQFETVPCNSNGDPCQMQH
ncbi:MAG: cation transporter [Nitrospina sp.]|nr:MAG: cation transporter [Nitrospina sp.]TDJ59383.1 MAG: cation transporter [Nitrospina sp.]